MDINDGLSQNSVFAMLQDHLGFMWFGTESGLNRYDGYEFKIYTAGDDPSAGPAHNWIRALFQDREHRIWIGSEGGLSYFDTDTQTFTHFLEDGENRSLNGVGVSSIVQDAAGLIYVGTYYGGVNILNPETGTFTYLKSDDSPQGLSSNWVRALCIDSRESLWIGTDKGLDRYDISTGTIQHFRHDPQDPTSLSHDEIRAIKEDRDGRIWVGTSEGLNLLEQMKGQFTRFYFENSESWVNTICQDPDGRLWVGIRMGGLFLFEENTNSFKNYRRNPFNPFSIAGNNVLKIYPDRSGNMWVSMYLSGLSKFERNPKKFKQYNASPINPNTLNHNHVRAIHQQKDGTLWVGTLKGLNRYSADRTKVQHIEPRPGGLSEPQVLTIAEDKYENIWMGTYFGGLNIMDPRTGEFQHFTNDPDNPTSLSHDVINAILRDRNDVMWMVTRRGLDRYDETRRQFINFRPTQAESAEFRDNHLLRIVQGPTGDLWLGSFSGGVFRFNPKKQSFSNFRNDPDDPNSLNHNMVTALLADSNGTIWVGTVMGLNALAPNSTSFVRYGHKMGFPDTNIHGILEGEPGELWFSTNRGLIRFFPKSNQFTVYEKNDGLQSNQFIQGAVFKSQKGEFFFGGINGFNAFFPNQIHRRDYVPPVVLTGFKVFGKELPMNVGLNNDTTIHLNYDQNFFSFEFAALDYTFPKKNQYAFVLEGFENDWVESGTRRFASYTKVPGGSYNFKVKGSSSDGIWNQHATSIKVVIHPPFWKTSWFQGGLAALLVMALIGGHKARTASIRRQNLLLEGMVTSRTKELQAVHSKLVKTAHQAGMAEIARDVLHNVGNILNSVQVTAEELVRMSKSSKIKGLRKANELLEAHQDHLADYLTNDPQGKLLPKYYQTLGNILQEEIDTITNEGKELREKIGMIKEAISNQYGFATASLFIEDLDLCELVDDAVNLQKYALEEQEVEIRRQYLTRPHGQLPRLKVVHAVAALIQNAREAMIDNPLQNRPRILTLEVKQTDDALAQISISDTGCGIKLEDQNRIFAYGFTTKTNGSGVGLHACGNSVKEMGGSIQVFSEGREKGATVVLTIPLQQLQDQDQEENQAKATT